METDCIRMMSALPADTPPPTDTAQLLPFHTVEGYGGGAFTPQAYLDNPTPTRRFGTLADATASRAWWLQIKDNL